MKLAVFIMMISALISGAKTEEVLTAMKPSNPVWLEFLHYTSSDHEEFSLACLC